MKKNKNWLKEELSKQIDILHTTISSGNYVSLVKRAEILNLIDQLEEPEMTEETFWEYMSEQYYFDKESFFEKLKEYNYLKKHSIVELPVIPQFVADWIEINKNIEIDYAFELIKSRAKSGKLDEFDNWVNKNKKMFARSFVDGYSVEKEKLYIIKFAPSVFGTSVYGSIGTQNGKKIMQNVYGSQEGIIIPNQYTIREIEEVGSKYMAFAEEVTE